MAMLVVYCYKEIDILSAPYGISELFAGVTVVLVHLWKKNTLISIIIGTVFYMILIQLIFI